MHNFKSATMVHNAPPLPLRPGDPPMTPVSTATSLGIQQAASTDEVTLRPNLLRQLTRTLSSRASPRYPPQPWRSYSSPC